jgi:predicted DNA-binding transcriptional regulator AlpA
MTQSEVWNAKDVAEYLRCSPRQVVERVRHRPGFPKAFTLGGGPLLWRAQDIRAYVDQLAAPSESRHHAETRA